ncbi:MAG: hypothetical protein QOG63_1955 [Thermoleophilaceae bacterium]|jgi:hypothetical protein|nr:hypothetical protein [Thermoleophilaceae bacterium]
MLPPASARRLAAALAVLVALAAPAAAGAKRGYTATPGPPQELASFSASYAGAGAYHTTFHAHPPNPGGADDRNSAHDRGTQAWAIRYHGRIEVPTCNSAAPDFDPCARVVGLDGARGATLMTGRVRHKHVDGLYRQLDASTRCRLTARTARDDELSTSLAARYIPASRSIGLTALDPVATATTLFPQQCPQQPDPIDRIMSFYAMPGFSFAGGYGPERWFTSREVRIPATVFHSSRQIRIPLHTIAAGRSPADCAVANPAYEECRTGGSWEGVLTLTARP